jgi:hypothetical protein
MMEPVRWLLANAELDRVLEQSSEARGAHLASLRARDAALAADVEALLAEHDALDAAGLLPSASGGGATQTGDMAPAVAVPPPGPARSVLAPGTILGPYRIVRPLGRGGMGAVYEADEIDSGRRVALKVLKERLHDPSERERFNREGRLAASLNHPRCVFVFAASEVEGRLAIAMELMQGTLADRLKTDGPIPPAEAVDAALQLLSGLQAASAIGILHRDVKPSNCFVDGDGVVKIGDFGISRSLRPSEEGTFSTRTRFAATPAYASPEQLRGAALDARADIYSLGATLYELLTGRPPFERDDLMALLMAVANDAPQPPHALVPAVPRGLSQVILRCLAKQPEQRFRDYDALAQALEPYSSTAAKPATLGARFFAGVVDQCLLGLLSALVTLWWLEVRVPIRVGPLHAHAAWFVVMLAYFGIAETVWAATPGKALVGLSIVASNGRTARASRAIARAALFSLFWSAGAVLWPTLLPDVDFLLLPTWIWILAVAVPLNSVGAWALTAAAFSSARHRNGYAAWHDLATGTRVVERSGLPEWRPAPHSVDMATRGQTTERLGPFHVTVDAIKGLPLGWCLGFDDRLRRPVWIRQALPGTPAMDARRLAVSRPTRLRWLAGRRDPQEAWDAFEAVPGVPLAQACIRPRNWADVRWWLLDLARECDAQVPGDDPPLLSERVWILDSGGAKLIDDPITDHAERPGSCAQGSCVSLLLDVVRTAQHASASPWPLSAHRFVDRLRAAPETFTASVIAGELQSLTRERGVLTRRWRALHMGGLVALPLMVAGFALFAYVGTATYLRRLPRDVHVVAYCLNHLRLADLGVVKASPQTLEAIEIVLATRYRHILSEAHGDHFYLGNASEQVRRVLRRQPTRVEEVRAGGDSLVRSIEYGGNHTRFGRPSPFEVGTRVVAHFTVALGGVAILALGAALVSRGGLMRAVGMEIVTANGWSASRRRVFIRTVLAWAPLIVAIFPAIEVLYVRLYVGGLSPAYSTEAMILWGLAMLAMLAGALFAILHPGRGIQDRLVGTWIVPR